MEVMEGPLNLAHQQSRRADRLLAAGKYEEAISCHKKASAYLSEAMKLTQSEQITSCMLERPGSFSLSAFHRRTTDISFRN
ncbi:nuclear receptor-binding factor 2-like [Leptonychotes weddellii]|uniref:Nuclear receptor-binding factor 2-like n=1 Tax=Leptonychotes weddellii TaxID=9713 RepID=A0A7F8QZ73_LEPWE|nr:nuclear receptor-binding factor 2-like [Leptonychotes weddellii]